MLLSIIVPVYNVEDYLSRCLDSLIQQDIDCNDYEIILINDGATDSSPLIIENYAKKYKQIKVINQKNGGLSFARNTGIKNCSGTYIYFVDSDDYIQTNVLKGLLELVASNNLDFLGFSFKTTTESNYNLNLNSENIIKNNASINVNDGSTFISEFNYFNYAWWYVFKKEILIENNIQFFEGIMLEDGIFTTELLLKSKRVAHISENIYRYFQSTNSIMRNKSKTHIDRLNNDFKFVITKFNYLIDLAKEKNANEKTLKRLKTRQQSYLFFLLIRLIRAKASFKEIQKILKEFKIMKVYPLNDFIGHDYNSNKEKVLTFIFNNKVLLFFFILFNNNFRVIK